MSRVFATRELPGGVLEKLAEHCELEVWRSETPPTQAQLHEQLQGCEGLVCLLSNPIDRALLEACPGLRFVSSMSVGVDHVDVPAMTGRGIPVGNTPGVLVETTADLTWALLMAAARRVAEADAFVRAGEWGASGPWQPNLFMGKDVGGATLGVIGLGDIGQAVARRARGFNMEVLGWTRSGREVEGVESVSFEEILLRSDFLCICVALTPDTRGLIDATAIAQMKPGAVLVNTARGGIVDEVALASALHSGALSAAGMDVFEQEPIDMDNPLVDIPTAVLVPHIGSATAATREAMAGLAVDNALAALRDEPMPHCVNPGVYD